MTTVYIDGDVIKYQAAFAGQVTQYGLEEPDGIIVYTATKKKLLASLGIEGNIISYPEPMPFEVVEQKVTSMITRIMNDTGADKGIVFLTDSDGSLNYRHQCAVTHPYKGNRKLIGDPFWKKATYELLKAMDNTIVVSGREADDALGCAITSDPSGICASIDKDLLMVPGNHYNFTSREITKSSDPGDIWLAEKSGAKKLKGHGFKWFCAQMLLGDPVDNIVGLHGYGPVKTHKVLSSVEGQFANYMKVQNLYIIELGKEQGKQRFQENADLLWIQRNTDERFDQWIRRH